MQEAVGLAWKACSIEGYLLEEGGEGLLHHIMAIPQLPHRKMIEIIGFLKKTSHDLMVHSRHCVGLGRLFLANRRAALLISDRDLSRSKWNI